MMRWSTLIASAVAMLSFYAVRSGAAAPAPADSYEAQQAKSVGVYDGRAILLPFVKTCDRERTSFRKLFCEALNERLKSQHQSRTYEQTFEPAEAGPLVPTFKRRPKPGFELKVRGCITCSKPMLNRAGGDIAKARFFVFKQPKAIRVRRGTTFDLVDVDLDTIKVPIKGADDDERPWTDRRFNNEVRPHLRLDVIYRPVAGVTQVGKRHKYGVLDFELVAWRAYNKCTGDVYRAQPAMTGKYKVDKNDLSCPQNRPDWGQKKVVLPPKLPETEVKQLMSLVEADLSACYNQFGVTGDYPVDITILATGRVKEVRVVGKTAGTPTAGCVERLLKNLRFPKFQGRQVHLAWPFKIEK